MNAADWMFLPAASGHLTLAVLCIARGRKSPLARALAILCADMFGWCFASLAHSMTGVGAWGAFDAVFTALSPPLVLDVIVTFTGARRAYRRVRAPAYIFFGALAISSTTGLAREWGLAWVGSRSWAEIFVLGWFPILGLVVLLLVRHLVQTSDADEKGRTRNMLAALALGGALATADLGSSFGFPLPHLAPLATLTGTLLVATSAFRFRLLDRDLSASTALYAIALAASGVVLYLVAFFWLGGNVAAAAFATISITLVLGLAAREVTSSLSSERARIERLAVLGRFSNQLAHDIKNPLATLKGALQFLSEERARGNSIDGQHEFLELMLEQVERVARVVNDYQRVGRIEPMCAEVDVNALVRSVVALEPYAAPDGISICADLAPGLPKCALDADLFSNALHNVLKNAVESMPNGGAVTVRTELAEAASGPSVLISIEDRGEGMDARRLERAFEEFHTTKAHGSGLGLAFVRRVALAHRGDVTVRSKVGVGTVVALRLPTMTM